MGINLGKIEPYQMGDNFPLRYVDPFKAGIVYLRVRSQGNVAEKQKHHSLSIDVGGETRHSNTGSIVKLVGLMLHVTASPSTLRTKYKHGRSTVIGNNDSIHVIGPLFNTSNVTPNHWAAQLQIIAENIYIGFVQNNNNEERWTSSLNCQLFVQRLIAFWNLNYPPFILTCSNLPPSIIDCSILCISSSTSLKQKVTRHSSNNDDEDSN